VGVKEILFDFLGSVDEPARTVLAQVLLLEQPMLDMERPRFKEDVKSIIENCVREEESRGK
jgi:hypothetical protein